MGRTSKPRIIVEINNGLVEVYCDNLDLGQVDLIMIDYDTDGADDDDLADVGGQRVFFSVGAVAQVDEDTGRAVAVAYDNWALTA